MVKLTGPGLGAAASGTLGDELIYSNWKGRAYLKKHAKPAQPNAPGQVGMRAIMKFLSSEWDSISAADKASWLGRAEAAEISPFNAYLSANLERWRSFLRPSQAYPATGTGPQGSTTGHGIVGGVRSILCTFMVTVLSDLWGKQIHHVAGTGVGVKWNDLIHIEPLHSTGWYTFTLTGFAAGTQWLAFTRFNTQGGKYGINIYLSCVVTD